MRYIIHIIHIRFQNQKIIRFFFRASAGDFGLEFVGRLVGEHIYRRSGTLEEVADNVGRDGDSGLEAVALHVAQDAVAQLAGDGG